LRSTVFLSGLLPPLPAAWPPKGGGGGGGGISMAAGRLMPISQRASLVAAAARPV